jgi:predicted N-acetyltransferase YhbS
MPLFSVRNERPSDIGGINVITQEAFANQLFSNQAEHLIVQRLRKAEALTVSLVADSAGSVIGHVAASPVQIAGEFIGWFGVGPLSVALSYQRQGIGSALLRAALAELQANGAAGCVLLGDPAFYCRFGFVRNPKLFLPGASSDHFMSLAWITPIPSGEVAYHDAFNAVA